MYWSRINTVDCRKRQGAEMNKDVQSFQAWVGRGTEESLGSTEAKHIWKEKFQFGQMRELLTLCLDRSSELGYGTKWL